MLGAATVALAVDLALGEPPRFHPTVGMGRWISAGRRRRVSDEPLGAFIEGGLVVALGAMLAGGGAALVDSRLGRRHPVLRGVALKPALSLRALLSAGRGVQRALARNDLRTARRRLARDLVSRDTATLSKSEVAGAAIESLAENLSDSVVAPLVAFRAAGLGGAYAYRFVNTADAMLGYHTPELEWFGKVAARADDASNLVPARVAAALLCLCAPVGRGDARRALQVALRDAGRTASPNAGWPMAAMAGALGVRLTKRDHYVLNGRAREPVAADLGRCIRIVFAAATIAAIGIDVL